MVLITLVAVAVALVATVRWILVRRQLRAITDQLRRRREAGVHAPVHLQLVDGALEALVVQINAVIAQIEQAGTSLERHERRYRELVADLSHDLRTPLTAVRGYQQLLAASGLDPTRRAHLAAAARHADRLASLVDEIFEYARLSDDGAGPDQDPDRVRVTRVEARAPDTLDVQTEPEALRRIISNLARNAVQHGRGRLRVELDRVADGDDGAAGDARCGTAGRVRLRMRNGLRRPEALDASRVLERRWSSDPAGTGLGLSIVELLAGRLGGTVGTGLVGEDFEVLLELPSVLAQPSPRTGS